MWIRARRRSGRENYGERRLKMPRWRGDFSQQITMVRSWLLDGEYNVSRTLLFQYYNRPFKGAGFDRLARGRSGTTIGSRKLDAIRALNIHPSRAMSDLLRFPQFQILVGEQLERLPSDIDLHKLSQTRFDELLEPGSPGWRLWEILALALRASRTREYFVGASKLASATRPKLIPVEDSVVRKTLKVSRTNAWRMSYELVSDSEIQEKLVRLQSEVAKTRSVPLHRMLDVVVWRRGR